MGDAARRETRGNLGLSRELSVLREEADSEPWLGGSRGYPLWYRIEVCRYARAHDVDAAVAMFRPCKRTVRSWLKRIIPYSMTGGSERVCIVGRDQLLLCLFLFVHPDAEDDEVAIFIFNNGGRLYSRQQICRRKKEMQYTRKRCSVEAYQALLPQNLLRVELFFERPPPLGIRTLELRKFIDFDETGISLEKCNRKNGSSYMALRVRKSGHYTRGQKVTVIYGFEPGDPALPANQDGSLENPRRWFKLLDNAGTDQETFADFVDEVLQSLEVSNLENDQHRVLLWDNLSAHMTALVYNTVHGRPTPNVFTIIPRPPYQPKYGPTEYHFAELCARLRQRVQPDWTRDILKLEILNILSELGRGGRAHNTFHYCLNFE
jgi:hypothetical protein